MEHTRLAELLFGALAKGDTDAIRSLCARDFRSSQNGGIAMDLESALALITSVHKVVANFRYENPVRSTTESGFVEEHIARGTLADGSRVDLPACVVAEVTGGKITELREYFDAKAADGLLRALSAA